MSFTSDVSTEGSLMVAVNAELDRLHRSFNLAESEFFCECGDAACKERVTFSRADYAKLRSESRSVLTPAHGYRAIPSKAEVHELGGTLHSLEDALAGRARIAQAKGILAERGDMTVDDALEVLCRRARKERRSLEGVCKAYISSLEAFKDET